MNTSGHGTLFLPACDYDVSYIPIIGYHSYLVKEKSAIISEKMYIFIYNRPRIHVNHLFYLEKSFFLIKCLIIIATIETERKNMHYINTYKTGRKDFTPPTKKHILTVIGGIKIIKNSTLPEEQGSWAFSEHSIILDRFTKTPTHTQIFSHKKISCLFGTASIEVSRRLNGKKEIYTLDEDDSIIIPAGSWCSIENASNASINLNVIHFGPILDPNDLIISPYETNVEIQIYPKKRKGLITRFGNNPLLRVNWPLVIPQL